MSYQYLNKNLCCFLLAGLFFTGVSNAQTASFDVKKVVVYGVNLMTNDEVSAAVGQLVGPGKTIADLDAARHRLMEAYALKGYDVVRVTVPPQEIKPGDPLNLQVTEPRLGNVSVRGNKFFNEANFIEVVGALTPGQVPNSHEVAKRIRLSNDHPSKKAQVVYRAGTEPDTVDAEIVVNDTRPNRFGVVLDNTGSKSSGRLRLALVGQLNNLFERDHQLSFQYQTDLESQSSIQVSSITYKVPIYSLGGTVEGFYVNSSADIGLVAGAAGVPALSVAGDGRAFGVRYTYLLDRLDVYDQRLVASYSDNEFSNRIAFGQITGADSLQTSNPLGFQYLIAGSKDNNQISANAGLFYASNVQNTDGATGLTNIAGNFDTSYTALKGGIQYQRLMGIANPGLTLQMQVSNDRLLNSDQFGVGGALSVRGFDERALTGDQGVSASLYSPFIGLEQYFGLTDFRLSAGPFYDYAVVNNNARPNALVTKTSISSMGLQIDLRHEYGSLSMAYARVTDGATIAENGEQRLHANLTLIY